MYPKYTHNAKILHLEIDESIIKWHYLQIILMNANHTVKQLLCLFAWVVVVLISVPNFLKQRISMTALAIAMMLLIIVTIVVSTTTTTHEIVLRMIFVSFFIHIYECVANVDLLLWLLFGDIWTLSVLLHGSLGGPFEPHFLWHGENGELKSCNRLCFDFSAHADKHDTLHYADIHLA